MSSISLQDIVGLNGRHAGLSLGQIQKFILLASTLQNDILLSQPSFIAASDAPKILPQTIIMFLKTSCEISEDCAKDCWATFGAKIWQEAELRLNENEINQDFTENGHALGLCASFT
jgi:hypothetical protein